MNNEHLTEEQTRRFLNSCIGRGGLNQLEYMKLLCALRRQESIGYFTPEAQTLISSEAARARF